MTDKFLQQLAHWRANSETPSGRLPMPPSMYTSEEIFDIEIEKIFKKEWMCTGHVNQLQEPGDYITFEIVDHPVFIIRDKEMLLHAYSNVCAHRSSRLVNGTGNAAVIVCPYHAWGYDLTGRLRGAPGFEPEQIKDICLNELKLEIWQGLIFVNLDPNAFPLSPRLEKLLPHVEKYKLSEKSIIYTMHDELECNWKVLTENFCESYHVFKVHKNSLEQCTPTSSVKIMPSGIGFNHHTLDRLSAQEGVDNKDHLSCIYPSLTISIEIRGALWLSICPINSNRLKYQAWLARDINSDDGSDEAIKQSIALFIEFMAEDKTIIEGVQQGLRTAVGNQGPLNELEKTNWDFAHDYANKMLG